MTEIGLGQTNADIRVYIANRPDHDGMAQVTYMRPLVRGEISDVGKACGNGWRKVFNVYAKLIYALSGQSTDTTSLPDWLGALPIQYPSWQAYRDSALLDASGQTALLFSPPLTVELEAGKAFHIVMGRTYAKGLDLPSLEWLNDSFAIAPEHRLVVCPYFDYRQLSNLKIVYLIELLLAMK